MLPYFAASAVLMILCKPRSEKFKDTFFVGAVKSYLTVCLGFSLFVLIRFGLGLERDSDGDPAGWNLALTVYLGLFYFLGLAFFLAVPLGGYGFRWLTPGPKAVPKLPVPGPIDIQLDGPVERDPFVNRSLSDRQELK